MSENLTTESRSIESGQGKSMWLFPLSLTQHGNQCHLYSHSPGADPGFVERGPQRLPRAPQARSPAIGGPGHAPRKNFKNKNKLLHSGGIVASSFRN